jgi:hypothetical protein
MKKSKAICPSKINAQVAYEKATEVIAAYKAAHPQEMADAAMDSQVHLRKLVLKASAFDKTGKRHHTDSPAAKQSKPFYGFVLNAGKKKVIVPVETGVAKVYSNEDILAEKSVQKTFSVSGVTYAVGDTINGIARYVPVRSRKKERRKLRLNGPIVTAAMAAMQDE